MHPFITFSIFSWSGTFGTRDVLLAISILATFGIFFFPVRKGRSFGLGAVPLILSTIVTAFVGARLFFYLWERPSLKFYSDGYVVDPKIWSSLNGMTLYGALLLGGAFFAAATQLFYPKSARTQLWNRCALSTALTIVLLRIACFAEGCCWGSLTDVPWAVYYEDDRSYMPVLGMPVHPVQLYEAGLCLLLFFFLVARIGRSRESVFPQLCIGYACVRFFTEFFRGDSYRGAHLLWSLSTSQLISVAILIAVLAIQVFRQIDARRKMVAA